VHHVGIYILEQFQRFDLLNYYKFVKYSVYAFIDMICIVSVTDAYMLGEHDETLFIRENVFGISKLKCDTDIRKTVQKEVVGN
jgi:hypothetical protein